MVLAFRPGVPGSLKSRSELIFLPCIYSFVSLLRTLVVKEGSMAPFQNGAILPSLEPKWGHTALPGGQYGPILSQIAKMGPYCPPWRAIWPHFDPSLPHGAKKEGEVFRMIQGGQYGPILPIATSRTRKEGGGEAILPPGRAIWVLETASSRME